MKISINSRDLTYTIDTYGMFSGDYIEESERDFYRDEYSLSDADADSISFEYDHPAIVRALAKESINLLHNEFVIHGDGIVRSIDFETSGSPQFYNYTTDHYTATWDIDETKLRAYIDSDIEEFKRFPIDEWSRELEAVLDGSDPDSIVVMLDFYTRNVYPSESYEFAMYEVESECWREHMTLDGDAEEVIKARETELEAEAKQIKMDLEA